MVVLEENLVNSNILLFIFAIKRIDILSYVVDFSSDSTILLNKRTRENYFPADFPTIMFTMSRAAGRSSFVNRERFFASNVNTTLNDGVHY